MKKHFVMQLIGLGTTGLNFLTLLVFFKRFGYTKSTDAVLIIINISGAVSGIFTAIISSGYSAYIANSDKNSNLIYVSLRNFLFFINTGIVFIVLLVWNLILSNQFQVNNIFLIGIASVYTSLLVIITLINQHNFYMRNYYRGQLTGFFFSAMALFIFNFISTSPEWILISYFFSGFIVYFFFKIKIDESRDFYNNSVPFDFIKKYFFINIYLQIFQLIPFFDSFYINKIGDGAYSKYQLAYKIIVAGTTLVATSIIAIYTNNFIDDRVNPKKSIVQFLSYTKKIILFSFLINVTFLLPILLYNFDFNIYGFILDQYFFISLFIISFIFAPSIIFLIYSRLCLIYDAVSYLFLPTFLWILGFFLIFILSFYVDIKYPFQLSISVSWFFCGFGIYLTWNKFVSILETAK